MLEMESQNWRSRPKIVHAHTMKKVTLVQILSFPFHGMYQRTENNVLIIQTHFMKSSITLFLLNLCIGVNLLIVVVTVENVSHSLLKYLSALTGASLCVCQLTIISTQCDAYFSLASFRLQCLPCALYISCLDYCFSHLISSACTVN